jgi:hypothetical protein
MARVRSLDSKRRENSSQQTSCGFSQGCTHACKAVIKAALCCACAWATDVLLRLRALLGNSTATINTLCTSAHGRAAVERRAQVACPRPFTFSYHFQPILYVDARNLRMTFDLSNIRFETHHRLQLSHPVQNYSTSLQSHHICR